MAKLTTINIDTFQRGDSSVLPWVLQRQDAEGNLTPFNLTGYRAALTISKAEYTDSYDDVTADAANRRAAVGYNDQYAIVNVDCDSSQDMHGISPTEGKILFDLHKQNMWITPGNYFVDVVLENKTNYRTHTYVIGKIVIQGHPTNRFTTDTTDNFYDVSEPEDV